MHVFAQLSLFTLFYFLHRQILVFYKTTNRRQFIYEIEFEIIPL
jgi:hypothetical protein